MTENAKGFPIAKAVRKDSAVHVSLSSDLPVKQPGTLRSHLARKPRILDAPTRTWPRLHGRMLGHRVNSEGLRRRAIAPSGGAPKRVIYSLAPPAVSTFRHTEKPCGSSENAANFAASAVCRRNPADRRRAARPHPRPRPEFGFSPKGAALRPYSSAVLCAILDCRNEGDATTVHFSFKASTNRAALATGRPAGHGVRVNIRAIRAKIDVVG